VLASSGILCGSAISLDTAVQNLVRTGVELPRAVAAATANPCALVGVADRGSFAPGLRADVVEFNDDLSVRRVMRGGHWIE
jgi:N-acetylglucosamine-6-phosphate deacetylase